ncbi:MAG: hypothetical protein Q8941_08570 [Bacteroidota bacterium]|nr:hypothetical protein [Bacteroidota bacterium]
MKKLIFIIIFTAIVIMSFLSGCMGPEYSHREYRHHERYEHRHHHRAEVGVGADIHIHN